MLFKCVLYYILTVINFFSGYLWVFCVLLLLCCRERQASQCFEGGMRQEKGGENIMCNRNQQTKKKRET